MSTSTSVDDRDPAVHYFPSGNDWTAHTQVEDKWQLYGNSDTFSDHQGAYFQYQFDGDGIEYWGNQGPYHGPCLVNIDGHDETTVNSHADQDDVPILLFSKDNLGSGQHTIKVTVVGAAYPNVCELDRFVVKKTATPNDNNSVTNEGDNNNHVNTVTVTTTTKRPSNTSTSTSPDSAYTTSNNNDAVTTQSKSTPWAAIGGAIGGGIALILIILAFWWYNRRSRHTQDLEDAIISARKTKAAAAKKPPLPPPTIIRDEKAAFGYEHAPPIPRQQDPIFSPLSPQYPQHVPPTPNSGQLLLTPYSTGGMPLHSPTSSHASTYFGAGQPRPLSEASSGYAYYADPAPQPQPPQAQLQPQPQLQPQLQPQPQPQPGFGYQASYPQQQPSIQPQQWATAVSGEPRAEATPVWATATAVSGEPQRTTSPATQRAASPATSGTTATGFPQEKAQYSRNAQAQAAAAASSSPGAGGSRGPAESRPSEGGAAPEMPPPAYDL